MHLKKNSFLILILLFITINPLFSEPAKQEFPKYFVSITPDILQLLPTPPLDGSSEQKAELEFLKKISQVRTKADILMAQSQIDLDFFTFAPVIGKWFTKESFPKTYVLFKKVEATTKTVTNSGKNYWKRKRPYEYDPTLKPLKKESSLSYPSGHSTRGMVYASVLAELFPDKKEELLKFGFNIGWYRIIASVHYPTDVNAGRTLGLAIAREILKNADFLKDLEAVREEIKAAAVR